MKSYTVLYEQGPESWGATVPDLAGCYAVGGTFEETEALIREAIELFIAQLKEEGLPVPEPVTRVGQVSVAA